MSAVGSLADIFEFVRNGKSVKQNKSRNGLPITRIETIANGIVDGSRVGYAGLQEAGNEKWLLQKGDILFSHINSVEHVGKCALYEGWPEKLIHGMNLLALRPNKHVVDARYAYRAISDPGFRASLQQFVNKAVNQASISATNLKSLELPLPSLDEQRRIAAILDRADDLRRKHWEAYRRVGELSDALFISMFGVCKLDAAMWPMSKVSNVGRVQLGRQRAPKYQTGKFTKPYVRVANVYEDRIDTTDLLYMDFNDADFRDYKLEHGDVLLNEGQSTELVGRPAMWRSEIEDCCFQNTLVRFQADRERVMPEFALALFLRYFRAGEFAKISSKTSNVAHLGASRFGMMPFPLPPLELQREFSCRLASVSSLKDQYRANAISGDALFSSLQHRAFSGQL
ncbi:restriction endonuclease subunit S [Bradyrhizobium sp. INPA03-11B]|uniref:restriction endonuclease subunit S n=1 Tax=Bradyrhizobium sp. INPA03-11B TaxID=418598 RepID=UPI00338E191C